MTSIDFYLLNPQGQKLEQVICQLCQKAYDGKQKTLLLTQDQQQSEHLDRQLWVFNEESFLPHDVEESEDFCTPILIQDNPQPRGERDLLINLRSEIPVYFAQFKRVIELVTEENKAQSREHYSYYKERGYPLKHIKL